MALTRKLRAGLAFLALVLLCSASIVNPQSLPVRTERVAWVVFVDDLHLDFRNTGRLRELLQTLLNDIVLEGDLVAIRTTGPSSVMTDFTTARELMSFVRKLAGNGLKPFEVVAIDHQSAEFEEMRYNEMRYRTRLSLSSATAAVALLGHVEPQRRGLLYISNGHPFDVTAFIEARALAGVAGQNGVKIFAIDGASLDRSLPSVAVSDPAWDAYKAAARDSLRVIAEQGGGFAILDAQGAAAALQQVSKIIRQ